MALATINWRGAGEVSGFGKNLEEGGGRAQVEKSLLKR